LGEIVTQNLQQGQQKKTKRSVLLKSISRNWELYLMITPVLIYFFIFHYLPMYGVQIAFKNFSVVKGIWGSSWIGFKHFIRFFKSYHFWALIKNTLGISIYQTAVAFPVPILLALMMNELRSEKFKKTLQTVTYAPHFLSTVVLVGMLTAFVSPRNGIINEFIKFFGGKPISFMTEPSWFKTLYVFSGVWQNAGWGSIIYMAALAGIDTQLYEAAIVDGATKLQRIWNVTIPGILPTAIILLIMDTGRIMSVGFEKVFLMQNGLNMVASDVISTYVYRMGLMSSEFSFSSAVGLFNSVINMTMLILVNKLAKKFGETSLW
jgi:putative aldouronate transport system permease protein